MLSKGCSCWQGIGRRDAQASAHRSYRYTGTDLAGSPRHSNLAEPATESWDNDFANLGILLNLPLPTLPTLIVVRPLHNLVSRKISNKRSMELPSLDGNTFPTAAVEYGNWKKPLDLTLPVTRQGEIRIPFSHHVRPSPSTVSSAQFPQAERLPLELVLRILHFCDKPTLFRLMHTSHDMRIEAKKLFYSDPDAWYHTGYAWLMKRGENCGGWCDPQFRTDVERLVIGFGGLNQTSIFETWPSRRSPPVLLPIDESIRVFWKSVRHHFPRVKRVILEDGLVRLHDQPLPDFVKKIGDMAPPEIETLISLLEGHNFNFPDAHRYTGRRTKRTWWRLSKTAGDTHEWTKFTQDAVLHHIKPPPKSSRGPVGEFNRMLNHGIEEQRWALRVHRIAAIERHHFVESHKPFGCSVQGCDAWFDQPEQYTTHAINTKHDKDDKPPEHLQELFAENERRLLKMIEDLHNQQRAFLKRYKGPSGIRPEAEKEFIHQLEHDPMWKGDMVVGEHPELKRLHYQLNNAQYDFDVEDLLNGCN